VEDGARGYGAARPLVKEADVKSGGRKRGRATWRQETCVTEDGRGRWWRQGDIMTERPEVKLRQRPNQQLPVRDEFDDALMFRRVRVLVRAMMKEIRMREDLQRQVQAQHQRDGEKISLHVSSLGQCHHRNDGSESIPRGQGK
jgi:hypothetical protein